MPTPRKKWPHESEWARADSISLAQLTIKVLLEAVDRTDDPATLRRLTKAIENQHRIISKLKECKGENNHD